MRVFSILMGGPFGLLFAAAGVFIAMQTAIPLFQDWQTMQSWQPHHATLLNLYGSDNDTQATYEYSWNGQSYQNDRVYVASFTDNIGSYHDKLYDHLDSLSRSRQPVPIFVNPNNPQQSVIDRDMRWGLFILVSGFCSIFILIGLTVIYACIKPRKMSVFKPPGTSELRHEYDAKKQDANFKQNFFDYRAFRLHELKQQAEQEGTPPRAPDAWRERKGWQENGIRSESRNGALFMWIFAIIWNAISSPVFFVLEDELNKGNYPTLISLLFPLVGIYLIYKAIRMTLEYRRYGVIRLMMDPYPGAIGGHVGGSLVVKRRYDMETEYRIGLECVYSYVSGSGDNRSRNERVRWSEQGTAKVESAAEGVLLSFRFDVPEDLPEADIDQRRNYYFWRLRLHAEVPGVDLDRTYNIPVFATAEQSERIDHDLSAQARDIREQQAEISGSAIERGDFYDTDLPRAMRIYDRTNELKLYHPMFRNKFLGMFSAVFGGAFSAATLTAFAGFWGSGQLLLGILVMVFMIPFALVGLLASAAAAYLLFNNLTVRISYNRIQIIRRLFVLPLLSRDFQSHEITSLSTKRTISIGQGNNKIDHYKIQAHYGTDKTITIAEGIAGEDLANAFKDYLSRRMGK